jgi:hypothetical protein
MPEMRFITSIVGFLEYDPFPQPKSFPDKLKIHRLLACHKECWRPNWELIRAQYEVGKMQTQAPHPMLYVVSGFS